MHPSCQTVIYPSACVHVSVPLSTRDMQPSASHSYEAIGHWAAAGLSPASPRKALSSNTRPRSEFGSTASRAWSSVCCRNAGSRLCGHRWCCSPRRLLHALVSGGGGPGQHGGTERQGTILAAGSCRISLPLAAVDHFLPRCLLCPDVSLPEVMLGSEMGG